MKHFRTTAASRLGLGFWFLVGLLLGLWWPAGLLAAETEQGELLFVRRVWPLLQEKCVACHGRDRKGIEGGLDLTARAGLLQGGDSGEAGVLPGKPDLSPLYLAARRDAEDWSAMPPKEAERLTAEQLAWLHEWIAAGAPWPDADRQARIVAAHGADWSAEDGVSVPTSGGLSREWTERKYKPESLWAYQPLRHPQPTPAEADLHPIDALLKRQVPDDLSLAPRADRGTLIRRATFDLTGLPPTPEDVRAFVHDPRSDRVAFAVVVERLLASPHYGERMAQHWLDVVRYADSSGFANDYERGNAWRYRDYVVRSFNADKPFDRFAREQLAGDEIDPRDPELLVATGFLRMGPWELTGMEVARIARQRFLDDVTNSVGEVFLAHALQCARCHDHKFDPIPTRDYYALQAVFAGTQLAERAAPFTPEENLQGFEEQAYLEARQREYEQILADLDAVLLENARRWYIEHGHSAEPWQRAVAEVAEKNSTGIFNAARQKLLRAGVPEEEFPPKLYGFTPEQFGLERVARKGLERLRWEFERYRPFALAVYNGPTPEVTAVTAPVRLPAKKGKTGDIEQICILAGGDPFARAEPVRPAVLSVVKTLPEPEIPETDSGRRLALADWIVHPDNPLTPRVFVNRVWLWHFGQPLAGNPNNFGSTGKRPTHPELLDWLAVTFLESGWSCKALHRQIMSSDAYCRASSHPRPSQLAELDPLGTSYAVFHPRRLTAEELRDARLVATGEWNPMLGGIPCRPEINREVALQPRQVMGTFATAWVPNTQPQQRHRRSLYVLRLRGLSVPQFEVFNAPAPDFSCELRDASTITPQVFSLFNGQDTHDRALALAQRVLNETTDDTHALNRCFELLLSRLPSEQESAWCLAHWRDIERLLPAQVPAAEPPPLQVLREAVEENTGEKFRFRETLHAHAEFVPDLQPGDVSSRARALADVCLALMNSNEFVYVY